MSDSVKTILFATGLCLVCSLLLTMAATGLKAYQRENALVDRQKNILMAVGAIEPERKYTADDVKALYQSTIQCVRVGRDGEVLSADAAARADDMPLYLYQEDDKPQAYIIPVDSRGLWGKIYGYLALETDGSTIAGFSVYQHAETPGLGGEIENQWFQRNFVGKQIVDDEGRFVSIRIAKGDVEDAVRQDLQPHFVDGISGATLTGRYLSEGLEDILQTYEPVSIHFRNQGMLKLPEKALVCQPSS
jgi:Na+-transporting NADH:ubiquinone oxidoreductase subunit C